MFIINSFLKKGFDMDSAPTNKLNSIALPSKVDGKDVKGSIKIESKEKVGTVNDLWKLGIEVNLTGVKGEEKKYTIYRYLPKPKQVPPAKGSPAKGSPGTGPTPGTGSPVTGPT
jgi:hypothetical protein